MAEKLQRIEASTWNRSMKIQKLFLDGQERKKTKRTNYFLTSGQSFEGGNPAGVDSMTNTGL